MAARWLERFAYRQADRIVALSPGMAHGVVATGVHRHAVEIVPNGCDLELFGPADDCASIDTYNFANQKKMCLYAGALGRVNGVSYIVEIAAEMQSIASETTFVIVGDGRETDLVRRKAVDYGVFDRTLFIESPVPKQEIARLFRSCSIALSVFVDIPAMWTNSANKFFDALAAGRAVAINYSGWQADLINKHGVGLVLPPKSPRASATMLADFLSRPETVRRSGWNARRLGERYFCRDKLSDMVREVIREAASGQAHRPK